MNLFVGIGKIDEVYLNGKVLKFNLSIQQERPCYVPCLVFNPSDEVKEFVEQLQSTKQIVWLQGRITSSEYEYQGRIIRKIDVVTYAKSIRII